MKLMKLFTNPTVLELAQQELLFAQKSLLIAETNREFAQARVDCYKMQIRRLKSFIVETEDSSKEQI